MEIHEKFDAARISAENEAALKEMLKTPYFDRPEVKLEQERRGKQRAATVLAAQDGATKIEQGETLTIAAFDERGTVRLAQVLAGVPMSSPVRLPQGYDFVELGGDPVSMPEPMILETVLTLTGPDLKRLRDLLATLPDHFFAPTRLGCLVTPEQLVGAEKFTAE